MYEIKCTISKVLRNFEVTIMPGFEPTFLVELILRSENVVWLQLKKRPNKM